MAGGQILFLGGKRREKYDFLGNNGAIQIVYLLRKKGKLMEFNFATREMRNRYSQVTRDINAVYSVGVDVLRGYINMLYMHRLLYILLVSRIIYAVVHNMAQNFFHCGQMENFSVPMHGHTVFIQNCVIVYAYCVLCMFQKCINPVKKGCALRCSILQFWNLT